MLQISCWQILCWHFLKLHLLCFLNKYYYACVELYYAPTMLTFDPKHVFFESYMLEKWQVSLGLPGPGPGPGPSESDSACGSSLSSDLDTHGETVSEPPSILTRLRAPTLSDLARKQKIKQPAKCTGRAKKHKAGAPNFTDPKTTTPAEHVKQFPGECLAVRSGKLFCDACREEIALKKVLSKATSTLERSIKVQRRRLVRSRHENVTSHRI